MSAASSWADIDRPDLGSAVGRIAGGRSGSGGEKIEKALLCV
jgi:hypothetical protein